MAARRLARRLGVVVLRPPRLMITNERRASGRRRASCVRTHRFDVTSSPSPPPGSAPTLDGGSRRRRGRAGARHGSGQLPPDPHRPGRVTRATPAGPLPTPDPVATLAAALLRLRASGDSNGIGHLFIDVRSSATAEPTAMIRRMMPPITIERREDTVLARGQPRQTWGAWWQSWVGDMIFPGPRLTPIRARSSGSASCSTTAYSGGSYVAGQGRMSACRTGRSREVPGGAAIVLPLRPHVHTRALTAAARPRGRAGRRRRPRFEIDP